MKEQNFCNYDDYSSPCEGYYYGRIIAFISALLTYIKNPLNEKVKLNAIVYTKGNEADYSTEITLTAKDMINSEYLMTYSNNKRAAIKISAITEIMFKDSIYINKSLNGIPDQKCITLQIADIIPPNHCIEIKRAKELLLKSCKDSAVVKEFSKIMLYHFILLNGFITSVSEGIATFEAPGGGTLFAPFSSILLLMGNFLD